MFTAIVLVCAGGISSPQTCYIYSNETLFETERECVLAIKEGFDANAFDYFDEFKNEYHKPKDFYCVNWNAERV